jgi:hypothetical protein
MRIRTFKTWLKTSGLGRLLLVPYRLFYALSYYWPMIRQIGPWLIHSREIDNFNYDVTGNSKEYTAAIVAMATGIPWQEAAGYVAEFEASLDDLHSHVRVHSVQRSDRFTSDANAMPGRRLIYYVLVRAHKPKIIVEAGVAGGLGTCILASAVQQNSAEGFAGRIYSVDLNPSSGSLIQPPFDRFVTFAKGDICGFLEANSPPAIDLYIHDTSCGPALENREFELIEGRTSENCIFLSAWHTRRLMDFARRLSRNYLMFCDQPLNHWYPGSRMGLVFRTPSVPQPIAQATEARKSCAFSS